MRSSSSIRGVGARQKWFEAVTFFSWRLSEGASLDGLKRLLAQLDDYRAAYERLTGRSFLQASVLEIGYGARPLRLIALMSMGVNVRGIDLDMPMLRPGPANLFRILRRNGLERALKTAVRSTLFDSRDRAKLGSLLRQRGHSLIIDRARFLVGDAATFDYGSDPIDFVYSDDVFEHIPADGLERLVRRLAQKIAPHGLALITPNVFTGITGGHLSEWYTHLVPEDTPRQSEPWEHLRKKRYTANTFLNGLTRAAYRELFGRHFHILEEHELNPDLGRRWFTPQVAAELSQWPYEELFSNRVQFVLRPKPQTT